MAFLRRAAVRASVVLIALFGALFAYAWCNPITADSPRLVDPARFKAEQLERFRAATRDPESVRFSGEFVAGPKSLLVVCGKVNRKAEGRGLTGLQRFIVSPTLKITDGEIDRDAMDELWSSMCARKR